MYHLVDVKAGFEQATLAFHDRRFDRVLHKADLMPAHVILNVDTQVLASQPGTDFIFISTLSENRTDPTSYIEEKQVFLKFLNASKDILFRC